MITYPNKPISAPPIQPEFWEDSASKIQVPMQQETNLLFRKEILRRCEIDPRFRDSFDLACKESPVLWVATLGWTFKIFDVGAEGKGKTRTIKLQPFIPWPDQVILLNKIHESILKGESRLLEKSREIGASWMFLYVFTHHFLFRRDCHISMLSRIEDDVDLLAGTVKAYPYQIVSDPGTLMGKVDYILNHLPAWQIPRMDRKRLHLVNKDNGSRLDGGASGVYTFSGQRRDAILFDEAAKNTNFRTVWEQTTDVALCKFAVSTPVPGAYFSKLRFSGQVPVDTFGWWSSPEKAHDLEAQEVSPGQWALTSSWRRYQDTIRSPNDVATNVDISYIDSGTPFFEGQIITRRKYENCRSPILRLSIELREEVPEFEIRQIILRRDLSKIIVRADGNGPWSLWVSPAIANLRCRPGEYDKLLSEGARFVFGVDTSLGMGASNSIISVVRHPTKIKVAEYASAKAPPHLFAKHIAAAAIWFGAGANRPLVVPEINGTCGFDLMRQLARIYGYPEIYRDTSLGHVYEKQKDGLGFSSSRSKKAALLGNLRRMYALNEFINPSEQAMAEAGDYIVAESGAIEPASLTEESENVKAAHGDRVIADALAVWPGSEHLETPDKPKELNSLAGIENAPWGSPGYRLREGGYDKERIGKPSPYSVKAGGRLDMKKFM